MAPGLRRVVAPNASPLTGPGTNSYLLGTGDYVAVDPGPDDPRHLEVLVRAAAGRLRYVVVTHTHPDHAPGAAALARATGAALLGFGARAGFVPDCTLGDGDVVAAGGWRLGVLHVPGHASDHLCFVADRDGTGTGTGTATGTAYDRLLFSGDHVIGGTTVVIAPPDGDMAAYLDGLARLAALDPPVTLIAPGHGALVTDPARAIRNYVEHRLEREAGVVAALARRPGARAEELVDDIYLGRLGRLRPAAVKTVWAHLRKLAADGRVRGDDPDDPATSWSLTA